MILFAAASVYLDMYSRFESDYCRTNISSDHDVLVHDPRGLPISPSTHERPKS
jgi:hypothetical protein